MVKEVEFQQKNLAIKIKNKKIYITIALKSDGLQ